MPLDTSYLVKHGNQWRVQVIVPRPLRAIVGKAKLVAPLRTDSLALASRDKHKHVHEFKQIIAAAEVEARRRAKRPADPLVEEAMTWRQAMEEARSQDAAADNAADRDDEDREPWYADTQADNVATALEARHDELVRAEGREKAGTFATIATAKGTPISALADDWLAEKPMKPRQKLDYRRAVTKFEAWALASQSGTGGMAEAVTKRTAGDYKTLGFVRAGANWRTANKDFSALSGYWKWLVTRGIAKENVWQGMLLPKLKREEGEQKRPYTDQELLRLLRGCVPSVALKDAMHIAALSGMWIEEICRVRVGDIRGDLIDLKGTKTAAARRIVPIHADLSATVARRCDGKASTAFLFDELPTPPPGSARERSSPLVKAFTRYRRAMGVDERAEGVRQSNVDFHSFRRWFAQAARDAINEGRGVGYSYWTIAEVMGHSKDGNLPLGMTMGLYAGEDTIDAKRACVAAVSLPK